jgi:hypothetical protein
MEALSVISNIKRKTMSEDTYESFVGANKEEILEWVKETGCADWLGDPLELRNNDSPSIREMLELADVYGDRITYTGGIARKPRSDYSVRVDGYTITGLTADEALDFVTESYADEISYDKNYADGTYTIHLWWD